MAHSQKLAYGLSHLLRPHPSDRPSDVVVQRCAPRTGGPSVHLSGRSEISGAQGGDCTRDLFLTKNLKVCAVLLTSGVGQESVRYVVFDGCVLTPSAGLEGVPTGGGASLGSL